MLFEGGGAAHNSRLARQDSLGDVVHKFGRELLQLLEHPPKLPVINGDTWNVGSMRDASGSQHLVQGVSPGAESGLGESPLTDEAVRTHERHYGVHFEAHGFHEADVGVLDVCGYSGARKARL